MTPKRAAARQSGGVGVGLILTLALAACRAGALPPSSTSAGSPAEVLHIRGLAFALPDDNSVEWWQRAPSLTRLATYAKGGSDVSVNGVSRPALTAAVSASFFSVLGTPIVRGRDFRPADDHREPVGSAIVRSAFWDGLGAKDDAIGRIEIAVGGRRYQVIGVVPNSDLFPSGVDIWIDAPFGTPGFDSLRAPRAAWVARLKPGATIADVEADLSAAQASLNSRYAAQGRSFGHTIQVRPLEAETGQASSQAP